MNIKKWFIRNIIILSSSILFALIAYFVVDISQWREDQSTVYWLGYINNIVNLPTGLISSRSISNPNGLLIISKLISFVPDFKFSIVIYALIQFFMIYFFINTLNLGSKLNKYLLHFVITFNYYFFLNSVEIWSQFFISSFNLFCIGIFFKNIKNNNVISLNSILLINLLLPIIYLGNFLNIFILDLIIFYLVFKKIILIDTKFSKKNLVSIAILLSFVWIPFFKNLEFKNFSQIKPNTENSFEIKTIIKNLLYKNLNEPFTFHESRLFFSDLLLKLTNVLKILNFSFKLFFLIFIGIIFLNFLLKKRNLNISLQLKILLLYMILFYLLAPVTSGYNFLLGERTDIEIQIYFLNLAIVFISALELLKFSKYKMLLKKVSFSFLIITILFNIYCLSIYRFEYLGYNNENALVNSDIPLFYKLKVAEIIFDDFRKISNDSINEFSVYYDIGGADFQWIDSFGENYPENYNSPYTTGRFFDLIFLKKYSLLNNQEGSQYRLPEKSDYLITYINFTNTNLSVLNVEVLAEINGYRIFKVLK